MSDALWFASELVLSDKITNWYYFWPFNWYYFWSFFLRVREWPCLRLVFCVAMNPKASWCQAADWMSGSVFLFPPSLLRLESSVSPEVSKSILFGYLIVLFCYSPCPPPHLQFWICKKGTTEQRWWRPRENQGF